MNRHLGLGGWNPAAGQARAEARSAIHRRPMRAWAAGCAGGGGWVVAGLTRPSGCGRTVHAGATGRSGCAGFAKAGLTRPSGRGRPV